MHLLQLIKFKIQYQHLVQSIEPNSTAQIIIMLTNTLKRLVFLARSTKRPPPQQTTQQSNDNNPQSQGFSHPISPTLKKIDKRFNAAQQKQRKQQEEVMKSFDQMKKTMYNDNQERRKIRQQKQRDAQQHLKNLQIPEDLRQRFRKVSYDRNNQNQYEGSNRSQQQVDHQQQLEKDFDNERNGYKSAKITGNSIKSEKQAQDLKRMLFQKADPFEEVKLQQEMIINEILKGSKEKEAKLNLPQDWKKELDKKQKEKEEQEMILNEKVRYEKLKQISSRQKDPKSRDSIIRSNSQLKRLDMLNDKYKIEVSPDQVWRSKHSPELIESAIDYKNKELHYFKQLVQGDKRDIWDDRREAGMMKPTKEQKDRKKKDKDLLIADKEAKNKQLGALVTPVQQQGLTRFKDLQYYKQKGVKQFQQKQTTPQYDIDLHQASQKDLLQGNRISEIFMDQFDDPAQLMLQKRQLYQKSTFGKYQLKLKQMSKKMIDLGIRHDYEDLALLKKEELFADKKMQEQNQSYKQYLLKKEKRKHMKEQLKKIHKDKLREDLNFDYEMDPVKLEKLDPLQMEQGLNRMEEIQRLKETTIVSSEFLKEKIHHTKTFKAMSQFISAYFYNNLQNPNNTINQKVQVGNILPNRKNTVLNIFWQFHPTYMKVMDRFQFNQDDIKREKKALQQKLQKQSAFISSKMTQYLGLRYGPDIRFYFNEILDDTQKSIQQMGRYKTEIIQLMVEEYKEKGLINTKEKQQQYRKKIQIMATNNLLDMNNQKKLLSKHFQKKQRLLQKMDKRKRDKVDKLDKKNNAEQLKMKKKWSERQLQQVALKKIVTDKVEARKEYIFSSAKEDQELFFGETVQKTNQKMQKKAGNVERKQKRSPVDRLWEEINKGV